jgi:hypothetical protein
MSDEYTRIQRAQKFRNPVARELHENKGAFALKVISPKKQQYKREKINPRNIELIIEEEEE